MAVNLIGRKIAMFRCHIDPAIGPKPKNAFNVADPSMKMEAELTPAGIFVKVLTPQKDNLTGKTYQPEHLIPYANIQNIKLAQNDENVSVSDDEMDALVQKKKK